MKHGALAWGFAALGLLLAVPAQAADTVYYYYTDSLHSAVAVTDAQGTVIERTYYAPYGQVLNRDLRDGPGYTGHAEDPETNLVYMQQRYYDPEAGRFLSTDPVQADGEGGSFNRYAYAADNPYRYYDPDGRQDCANSSKDKGGRCGPPPGQPCTGSLIGGGACGALNLSVTIIDNYYRRGADNGAASGIGKPPSMIAPSGQLSYPQMTHLVATNNKSKQSDALIIAVAWKESSFEPSAHAVGSSAIGLMMMTRGAALDAGYPYYTLSDPATNIRAASTYLQLRIDEAHGSVRNGLNGYGTGVGYADNILRAAYELEFPYIEQPQAVLDKIHP